MNVPCSLTKIYKILFSIFLLGFFIVYTNFTYAADVIVTPSTGSFNNGQTFTANIQVDPKTDKINAVEGSLVFDKSILSVVSISKTGSVFSLWPVEPSFSNSAGTIDFGGGHTAPISSRSTLLTITFKAIAEGVGTVSFSEASVLAADGLGTDVLKESLGASYTIIAKTNNTDLEAEKTPETISKPPPDSTEAIAFGDPPRAPEIGSQTFLDPNVWYNKTEGVFTWSVPFDVDAVAVEIATSSENKPTKVFEPPVEEFSINKSVLIEGVQYVSVQYRNQVGWGAITNRKLQIDTEPPEPFDIKVQTSNSKTGFPLIVFAANDKTSGIERYELFVADKEPVKVTPDEAELGFLLKDLEDGTYTVKIVAYDKAGNSTESSKPVLITAGWTKPNTDVEEISFWSFLTLLNIFIFLLIVMVIIEFIYIIYEKKQFTKKEEILRKETKEIQTQMEKIFSALRDEIYDQINTITKRKRLSAKEKEAVEGLNQALEVSETLIEKEIGDVEKILK